MTVTAHPALFADVADAFGLPPADPTVRDLAATLTTIRDAAEHLLTTLSDAARTAVALAEADERDETGDATLDPSCARGRHWFTYYGRVGTSSRTCTRPGCEVENPRYNPVNDPNVRVIVEPTA